MAYADGLTVVRDGNNTAVNGGVRSIDESGSGVGPWIPTAAIKGGGGVANAAEVGNADETPASTKYGLITRVIGLLTALGGVTETAPITDIASSGLNGRLQRIAQNLTALAPAAHDAVISGNPTRIGARALTADYTAVSSGDVADLVATLVGALVVKPYSIPEDHWNYAAASGGIDNTNTAVTIKAAAAAGLRNYITSIQLHTDGALGTATEVAIRDGAGGTVLWRDKISTTGILTPVAIPFPVPLKGSVATLLEFLTITAASTGKVYFNAQGYVAP